MSSLALASLLLAAQPCIPVVQDRQFPTPVHEPPPFSLTTDVEATRERAIAMIWGKRGLPEGMPQSVEVTSAEVLHDPPLNLAKTERLSFDMGFLQAVAYVFTPTRPNGRLMIYHAGHELSHETAFFAEPTDAIEAFIREGYRVAAFSMPVSGINRELRPTVLLRGQKAVHLRSHEQLRLLDSSPRILRYFLTPVVEALNYLLAESPYSSVAMMGLSGGGWSTTMLAAVDLRIQHSYPVAGSLPMYLRFHANQNYGDFEQTIPAFYRSVDYLDLYLLGASGNARSQVQTLIKYDTCCFSVDSTPNYVESVRMAGGAFDFWLDDSVIGHAVTPCTIARIMADLDKKAK